MPVHGSVDGFAVGSGAGEAPATAASIALISTAISGTPRKRVPFTSTVGVDSMPVRTPAAVSSSTATSGSGSSMQVANAVASRPTDAATWARRGRAKPPPFTPLWAAYTASCISQYLPSRAAHWTATAASTDSSPRNAKSRCTSATVPSAIRDSSLGMTSWAKVAQ